MIAIIAIERGLLRGSVGSVVVGKLSCGEKGRPIDLLVGAKASHVLL